MSGSMFRLEICFLMDRNTEVKKSYEDMLGLVERFQKRQALVVEGEWYVLDQEGCRSKIVRGMGEGFLAGATSSDGSTLVEGPCPIQKAEEMGWKVTPVTIFRKE